MPPLTNTPSGNKRHMGGDLAPVTEPVAQMLFASVRATVKTSRPSKSETPKIRPLPITLTESN